jgi:hypothetical protein
MEHTPGPWTGRTIVGKLFEITDSDGEPVLRVRSGMMPTQPDARLIAAAPDLLAALEALAEQTAMNFPEMRPDSHHGAILERARAAINKAKGE